MANESYWYLIAFLSSYLLGSVPTGVMLTKSRYGLDVREMGSGNIGATNVTRVFGWYAGVLTFLFDFIKGVVPTYWAYHFFGTDPWLVTVTGIATVLGHCYSVFLSFRGGKGVATSLGAIVVVAPWVGVTAGVLYLVVLAATRISAVGSLCGIAVAAGYVALKFPVLPISTLILSVSILVLVRHKSNIQRMLVEGISVKKKRVEP